MECSLNDPWGHAVQGAGSRDIPRTVGDLGTAPARKLPGNLPPPTWRPRWRPRQQPASRCATVGERGVPGATAATARPEEILFQHGQSLLVSRSSRWQISWFWLELKQRARRNSGYSSTSGLQHSGQSLRSGGMVQALVRVQA